jgi:ABC-type transporter Mla subunit MlaD
MIVRVAKLSVLLLVATSLAACGGGSDTNRAGTTPTATPSSPSTETVSAEEYMQTLCSETLNWFETIQEDAGEIQALGTDTPPDEAKEKLQGFLDATIENTDELISAVEEQAPDVENGEEISDDVAAAFGDAKEAFEEAKDQVDDLPTDDQEAFDQQLSEIGSALSAQGDALREGFGALSDSEELETASEEVDACAELPSIQ